MDVSVGCSRWITGIWIQMSNDASRGTIWRRSTIQIGCNGSLIFLRLNCGRNLPWRQHCCIGAALDWMLELWDLQLQLQHPRWTWGWRPTSNLYLTRSPRTSMMDMTLRESLTCCLHCGQNLAFWASFIFIIFISFLFAYALSIKVQTSNGFQIQIPRSWLEQK